MRVLFVGAYKWRDWAAIEANMAEIAASCPSAILVCGGKGPTDGAAMRAATRLGLTVEVVSPMRPFTEWLAACRPDIVLAYRVRHGGHIVRIVARECLALGIAVQVAWEPRRVAA